MSLVHLIRIALLSLVVLITACNSSPDNNQAQDDDLHTPPTAPGELAGVFYPGTGVELTWTAAIDDVQVIGYDVLRDSVVLVSAVDATTYLDTTAGLVGDYDYEVQAIDDKGTRGPAALVRVTTLVAAPILSQKNWFLVVGAVFDVYTHAFYGDTLERVTRFDYTDLPERRYDFPYSNSPVEYYAEYDCTDGGLVTRRGSPVSCDGRCRTVTQMFYACAIADASLLGRLVANSDYTASSDTFESLSITQSDGSSTFIDGTLSKSTIGSIYSDDFRVFAELLRYEASISTGTTLLTNVDSVFGYGRDEGGGTASAELSGSLTMASPLIDNASVTVTTPVRFVNESSELRTFPVGTLRIDAEDGSAIELEADNGDASSFAITLSVNGVIQESSTEQWDDWLEWLSFPDAL